jgi:hypothetical protein
MDVKDIVGIEVGKDEDEGTDGEALTEVLGTAVGKPDGILVGVNTSYTLGIVLGKADGLCVGLDTVEILGIALGNTEILGFDVGNKSSDVGDVVNPGFNVTGNKLGAKNIGVGFVVPSIGTGS